VPQDDRDGVAQLFLVPDLFFLMFNSLILLVKSSKKSGINLGKRAHGPSSYCNSCEIRRSCWTNLNLTVLSFSFSIGLLNDMPLE
jgi:hypothetical protein